jgi:hypothetical protein
LLGELRLTWKDDVTGRPVYEIRYVTSNTYPSAGYIVTKVGLPPIESTEIFSTEEAQTYIERVLSIRKLIYICHTLSKKQQNLFSQRCKSFNYLVRLLPYRYFKTVNTV